jgi:hypothetical protein
VSASSGLRDKLALREKGLSTNSSGLEARTRSHPTKIPEQNLPVEGGGRRTIMADSIDGLDVLCIPALTTERLRLRSFRKSDLDDYAALNADPEVL